MNPRIRNALLAATLLSTAAGCSSEPPRARTLAFAGSASQTLQSSSRLPATDPKEGLDAGPAGVSDGSPWGLDGGEGADSRAARAAIDAAPAFDKGGDADAQPGPGASSGCDSDSDAGFFACETDDDCVAVPKVGCCHLGWLVAVSRTEADAYAASFQCPQPSPICPMLQVLDSRVPECDDKTHACEMVRVDQIECGGFVKAAHRCPDGFSCVHRDSLPDLPGACVRDAGGLD